MTRSALKPQPEAPTTTDSLPWQSHCLPDASEQAALQSWLPLECMQLSAGDYVGSYDQLCIDGQLVVRENQNRVLHKSGVMAEGSCTISFQSGPRLPWRFSEFDGNAASQFFLLPAGAEFDLQVPAGCETVYVRLEQQRLLDAARAFDEQQWSRAPEQLTAFLGPGRGQLDAFFDELLRLASGGPHPRRLPDSDHLARAVLDQILFALDQSTTHFCGDTPDHRSRRRTLSLVNSAREYIDAQLAQDYCPSIVELCAHAGVSQRVLAYAFRELLHMPPVAYLRIARLNRVRATLRAPSLCSPTVTEVATQWGFFHLGRFAIDYRRMFGEAPSVTLRRAIG